MRNESPEITDTIGLFSNREIDSLKIIVTHMKRDDKKNVTEITIATELPNKEDWEKIHDVISTKPELQKAKVVIESLEDRSEIAKEYRRLSWKAMEAVMAEDARNRKIEKKKK